MLVLSRKVGERIAIGAEITIVVTRATRNRVVLGIEAPEEVPVRRAELLLEMERATTPAVPVVATETVYFPQPLS